MLSGIQLGVFARRCGQSLMAVCFLAIQSISLQAWDRGTVAYEEGFSAVIEPVMPDQKTHLIGRTPGGPMIRLSIRSSRSDAVNGALLYAGITDFTGRGMEDFTQRIDLGPGEEKLVELKAEALTGRPGFYDVRVLLFDRGRELGKKEFSFGYDVQSLPVRVYRPDDFDRFWKATLDSLAIVALSPTVQKDTLLSSAMVEVFRVSFTSLHGVRVHGWYTLPGWKPGPHAALVVYPGYSTGRISPAKALSSEGYATLAIQVRGYGVDQESYPEDNRRYMTIGVESPETYVYRAIICHCLRAVDFLAARSEVDPERIGAVGGSQGGGLALLAAGLDRRIKLAAANVPFLTDFPSSLSMTGNPYRDLVRYLESHPESRERVMHTVSYFDALNLAGKITVPVIVSIGLFDRTCPAPSIYGMYLELASSDKTVEIYPYLDHPEVNKEFGPVRRNWIKKHLPPVVNIN
jgi:cephalosporin-C deacetylase